MTATTQEVSERLSMMPARQVDVRRIGRDDTHAQERRACTPQRAGRDAYSAIAAPTNVCVTLSTARRCDTAIADRAAGCESVENSRHLRDLRHARVSTAGHPRKSLSRRSRPSGADFAVASCSPGHRNPWFTSGRSVMALRTRLGLVVVAVSLIGLTGPLAARQGPPARQRSARPDFDIRERRAPSPGSARARARSFSVAPAGCGAGPGSTPTPAPSASSTRPAGRRRAPRSRWRFTTRLRQAIDRLGLDDDDLDGLTVVRDYTSQSNGVRHVTFAQAFDGVPVFGGAVTVHIAPSGEIVRVNSSAARGAGRRYTPRLAADQAAAAASLDIDPGAAFVPQRVGTGPRPGAARFAKGPFRRDVAASLVWFAIDGGLRLAWHVELEPRGRRSPTTCCSTPTPASCSCAATACSTATAAAGCCSPSLEARKPDAMPFGAWILPAADQPRAPRSHRALPRFGERALRHRQAIGQQRARLPRQQLDRGRTRDVRRLAVAVRLSLQLRRCRRNGALLRAQLRPRLPSTTSASTRPPATSR